MPRPFVLHVRPGTPFAGCRIIELCAFSAGRSQRGIIKEPTRHQDLSIRQEGCGVVVSCLTQWARSAPSSSRVVEISGVEVVDPILASPHHEHLPVRQKRRGMPLAGSGHGSGRRPRIISRVVELGIRENTCSVFASGNENLPILKEGGGEKVPRPGHGADTGPDESLGARASRRHFLSLRGGPRGMCPPVLDLGSLHCNRQRSGKEKRKDHSDALPRATHGMPPSRFGAWMRMEAECLPAPFLSVSI